MLVYLDNAATTPMDVQVIEKMTEVMHDCYGNASAIHGQGRKAKVEVEVVRKRISKILGAESGEIFFTSGGTEADNMALFCSVRDLGVERIITTTIEHHAVGHPIEFMVERGEVQVQYLSLNEYGDIDLSELETLLETGPKTLVSLMFSNNEIGNLYPVSQISALCQKHDALFHSDTVQAMGHLPINVKDVHYDFLTCSAHKIHGPKGIGFVYVKSGLKVKPFIQGGGQEGSMRAGTENVTGIAGLAKALEVANRNIKVKIDTVKRIKTYFKKQLTNKIPAVCFNGDTSDEGGLYTVLNVSLPPCDGASTLLFQLDMNGICASGGSACNSGAIGDSHVLNGINHPVDRSAIRFSFSKFTTRKEVDYAVEKLAELL